MGPSTSHETQEWTGNGNRGGTGFWVHYRPWTNAHGFVVFCLDFLIIVSGESISIIYPFQLFTHILQGDPNVISHTEYK